jgi:adenosine kinase
VVIAPDDPAAMTRHPRESRDGGIPYVFCPGQQTVALTSDQLTDAVRGARCVVGNDYEMELIREKTRLSQTELLGLAETVVTTLGDQGSRVQTAGETHEIEAVLPVRVADPTGAGDAYVAGFAWGVAHGRTARDCGRIGALVASYAVEQHGTQAHHFDPIELGDRSGTAFGEDLLSGM